MKILTKIKQFNIQLKESAGKVLYNTETLEAGVTEKKISTATLSSGLYLLKITTGKEEKVQKQFVVK